MGVFDFLKKSRTESVPVDISKYVPQRYSLHEVSDLLTGTNCGSNLIELYKSIPEVAFPINFIANRVKAGKFQLKRAQDDSIVWDNTQINKFLSNPNPLQSFDELLSTHIAYQCITGNSFIKAAMSRDITTKEIWKWCDNYWVLPANKVIIDTPFLVPLFSTLGVSDIIKSYNLTYGGIIEKIPPHLILHSKENSIGCSNILKGASRLTSQTKPMSNLIAVYEARNIIYTKRGALGAFVTKKQDDSGTVAFTPKEKDEIRKEYESTYGVTDGRSPAMIINQPSDFLRMNMSISELEPFEETLVDACQIAGAFEIPSELIPRKDHSTYSNQRECEAKVYSNVVIPKAKEFCSSMTSFMGLDSSGLYLDVDFSHIDVLKDGFKKEQESKEVVSRRCKEEYLCGVITLNDWRAQIGESRRENPLYDKFSTELTSDELNLILTLFSNKNGKGTNDNNLQNQGK